MPLIKHLSLLFSIFSVLKLETVHSIAYFAGVQVSLPSLIHPRNADIVESERSVNLWTNYVMSEYFIESHRLAGVDFGGSYEYRVKSDSHPNSQSSATGFAARLCSFKQTVHVSDKQLFVYAKMPVEEDTENNIRFDYNKFLSQKVTTMAFDPLNDRRSPLLLELIESELRNVNEEIWRVIKSSAKGCIEDAAHGSEHRTKFTVKDFESLFEYCKALLFEETKFTKASSKNSAYCLVVVNLAQFRFLRSPKLRKMISAELHNAFFKDIIEGLERNRNRLIAIFDNGLYCAALLSVLVRDVDNPYLGDLSFIKNQELLTASLKSGVGLLRQNSELELQFVIDEHEMVNVRAILDYKEVSICNSNYCRISELETEFQQYLGQSTEEIFGLEIRISFYETQGFLFAMILLSAWMILVLLGMVYANSQKLKIRKLMSRNEQDNFAQFQKGLQVEN